MQDAFGLVAVTITEQEVASQTGQSSLALWMQREQ